MTDSPYLSILFYKYGKTVATVKKVGTGGGIFFKKRSEWYKNFSEKLAEIGTANDLPEIPEIQRSTSERKLNFQEQKF